MPDLARAQGASMMPESDTPQSLVADLRALITRIDTSMRMIGAAMELADPFDPSGSTDLVVLDDLKPRYATASAALLACRAGLDDALQHMSDFGKPG